MMNTPNVISWQNHTRSGPVKAVSVVSTGAVEIHPEHRFGSRMPLYWWLFTSRSWTPPIPINAYVIEHSRGLVLFDTGQDRASVTDRRYFPGGFSGFLYSRLARFQIGEEDTLAAKLATLGYSITDVNLAILSHLHQDHIGGLPELAGANLVVTDTEWRELSRAFPEARGFLRKHIEIPGLKWKQINFESSEDSSLYPFTESYDLMGDGSLVLLPTPGHTAGSMSLLVRREPRSPLLMVGDLTYGAEILEKGDVPGVGVRRQLRESSKKVMALRKSMPDLVVLPAHDPTAAQRLLESERGHVIRNERELAQ
jgi:glyoxylase-like metal-dependent hydrolase (beta-lactamase superfamily II)